MRSGGNYAPIDRRRSWSHSWVAGSAGGGRGGVKREGRERQRVSSPANCSDTSKVLKHKKERKKHTALLCPFSLCCFFL